MCANYIYGGTLEDITIDKVVLREPSIIYETGPWDAKAWKDAQKLPTDRLYLERSAVESFFELKRGSR